MSFRKYLLLTMLILLSTQTISQTCDLQNDFNQQIVQVQHEQFYLCLRKALRNGWENVIKYLVQNKKNQQQNEFINIFSSQIKRLQFLEEEIVLASSQTEPVLKWGQNQTHILINFKLSHRWDSPPCLNTRHQNSQITQQKFNYINVCLVSHQNISFHVNLNLYRNVIADNQTFKSQIKKDGVGSYSIILQKSIPQIWIFLNSQQKHYQMWHEISERYSNDYNQYVNKLQMYKAQNSKKMDQMKKSQKSQISEESGVSAVSSQL